MTVAQKTGAAPVSSAQKTGAAPVSSPVFSERVSGISTDAPVSRRAAAQRAPQSLLSRAVPRRGPRKRLQHVSVWARQLNVLVRSGTPLAQAMEAVERQAPDPRWREVLGDVRRQLDEGTSLSDAMERHPRWFDAIARSLVAAGESTGQIDAMLDRLARLVRQQLRIRRSLVGALVYPALLIVVAAAVLVAMIGFVLPRFEGLFQTLDAPLPPTTKLLMGVSYFFRTYWWVMLILGVVLAVAARLYLVSDHGRRAQDAWAVKAPWIGTIVRSFETARIARLLGTLIESKVTLVEALELTERSAGNALYRDLVARATLSVTRGQTMSAVFASSALVNPSVAEATRHGEASGQVGSLLLDMADYMDEENEALVRTLTSVIEPVILIGLGAMVTFIALSMFLPLFDLTAMT